MKMQHWILLAALVAVAGGGVGGWLMSSSSSTGAPAADDRKQADTVPVKHAVPVEPTPVATTPVSNDPAQVAAPLPAPEKASKNGLAPGDAPLKINGYEVQDPMARLALNFVGADPAAEAYWIGAINDDSLPAEERKDLIEDLNEDGLSDPRHPTAQDMPLIAARIRLIEQLAPNAMDKVNQDAFQEAYQDLVDLLHGKGPK